MVFGNAGKLKTVQNFLRGNAKIGYGGSNKKLVKREEEKLLLSFATTTEKLPNTLQAIFFVTFHFIVSTN